MQICDIANMFAKEASLNLRAWIKAIFIYGSKRKYLLDKFAKDPILRRHVYLKLYFADLISLEQYKDLMEAETNNYDDNE